MESKRIFFPWLTWAETLKNCRICCHHTCQIQAKNIFSFGVLYHDVFERTLLADFLFEFVLSWQFCEFVTFLGMVKTWPFFKRLRWLSELLGTKNCHELNHQDVVEMQSFSVPTFPWQTHGIGIFTYIYHNETRIDYPYHPWDWHIYLHLVDSYGKYMGVSKNRGKPPKNGWWK